MFEYQQYSPAESLKPFVECFWILRDQPRSTLQQERLIPGGRIEWMFNFAAPFHLYVDQPHAADRHNEAGWLMGQRDRIFYAKQGGETDLLGIRFKPGGLFAFSGRSPDILLNKVIPAAALLGSWATALGEELKDLTKRDEYRLERLNDMLLRRMAEPSASFHQALALTTSASKKEDGMSIAAFCEEQGLYYKKLERLMIGFVGYTPKSYFRLIRFNKALRLMAQTPMSFTSVAHSAGYFDQSHFNKDFIRYTGARPGRYDLDKPGISNLLLHHQSV